MRYRVNGVFKPVFHFNRIVANRSVSYCPHIISSAWVFTKQLNTLRFATIRLKWKTGFIIHFTAEGWWIMACALIFIRQNLNRSRQRNFLLQFFYCIKKISQNHNITSFIEFLFFNCLTLGDIQSYYLLKMIQKFWLVESGGWNCHIRSVVAQIRSYDIIIEYS